jgi:hypothetical protein
VEPLPEPIARFLDEQVESIDQLEILRILGEDREREWDVVALAGEVQAKPQAVHDHLTAMSARGLLVLATREAGLFCRHGASTPELEAMVGRLLQLYKERPVTMIKLVYDRARDPLRAFADAFRIRKEG